MSVLINKDSSPTYYLVSNNDFSIVHHGYVGVDNEMKSGLTNLELFETQEDLNLRLIEIGTI